MFLYDGTDYPAKGMHGAFPTHVPGIGYLKKLVANFNNRDKFEKDDEVPYLWAFALEDGDAVDHGGYTLFMLLKSTACEDA